ncbi:MAG TPA: histidine phosphatase family protein [Bacteroidia bacterium]|nr:histidine phosphatase family protein [Bacteroidia bacterium]
MKIGLIRHFKVKYTLPKKTFLTRSDLIRWFDEYELNDVEHNEVDLRGIAWKRCFSSPVNRAIYTAEQIHTGEIVKVPELKELDILHLMWGKIKLPLILWIILVRMKSSSSNEVTHEFRKKITAFVDELLLKSNEDTLIVSHGFVMMFLQKELNRRGFKGDRFRTPENGKAYIYER